jgi:hypothetical protein
MQILFLTYKGLRPIFSKNTPKLPFLAQEGQMKKKRLFALSTIRSCPRLLGEHVQKVCEIITFEVERILFFPSCPASPAKFDRLWCKNFELRKLGVLHHLNAHHVRYL